MKSKLFLVATATLLFASCAKETTTELAPAPEASADFTAVIADDSRAELGDANAVLWEDDDQLTIFTKTAHNRQYQVKELSADKRTATFGYLGYSGSDPSVISANYAVYPYNAAATLSGDVITTEIADEQAYDATKVDLANALMVAKSDDNTLQFVNAGALLRFKVAKQDMPDSYTLKSIKVASVANKLAGEVTIDLAGESKAVVSDSGVQEVVLTGIDSEITSEALVCYMALPATLFAADDLTVTFSLTENGVAGEVVKSLPAFELKQGTIKSISYTINNDDFTGNTPDYVPVVEVNTPEALAEALTADNEEIKVVLDSDIELPVSLLGTAASGGVHQLGGVNTKAIELDLNGYKLTLVSTYMSAIGAKNADALITIKNGSMTSSQETGTWNIYDLIFSNCDYVIQDVVFGKSIALENAGKSTLIERVTINESHDYYAMWITAEGQSVTLNDLTINSAGRGIKIDEQYVETAAKVTLNVVKAKFSTVNKAAIMVKSVEGAEINVTEIDITGVASDSYNAVWVDEDSAAYADKVIVNGAYMAVEGTVSVVSPEEDLSDVISEGVTNLQLSEGSYTMPSVNGSDVTFVGDSDAVITINKPNLTNSNVTFEGVTIQGSGYATGVQHVNTATYNKVTIKGDMCLYGEKVVFNECTFELGKDQYIWTYGADEVEFIDCTFNTAGKAILIYNEGDGASNVKVTRCKFYATAGAKAGAIGNQNCAAIEIDNFQTSGTGTSYILTTEGNTYEGEEKFSGEWRIKSFMDGGVITVNGTAYDTIAIDGKKMTIDDDKNVTILY